MEVTPISLESDLGRSGLVFDWNTLELMIEAANELNLTQEKPKYVVCLADPYHIDLDFYGNPLPRGQSRVKVEGSWQETGDTDELWNRVNELRAENFRNINLLKMLYDNESDSGEEYHEDEEAY